MSESHPLDADRLGLSKSDWTKIRRHYNALRDLPLSEALTAEAVADIQAALDLKAAYRPPTLHSALKEVLVTSGRISEHQEGAGAPRTTKSARRLSSTSSGTVAEPGRADTRPLPPALLAHLDQLNHHQTHELARVTQALLHAQDIALERATAAQQQHTLSLTVVVEEVAERQGSLSRQLSSQLDYLCDGVDALSLRRQTDRSLMAVEHQAREAADQAMVVALQDLKHRCEESDRAWSKRLDALQAEWAAERTTSRQMLMSLVDVVHQLQREMTTQAANMPAFLTQLAALRGDVQQWSQDQTAAQHRARIRSDEGEQQVLALFSKVDELRAEGRRTTNIMANIWSRLSGSAYAEAEQPGKLSVLFRRAFLN
ncbi:hypothetical protein [Deinococcus soli (ex Cha et al. 2016)]|uniref:Skp family chaperone for outer membrane proteins n=2 Tax=Deinococcus soli (ex Cha et al. 2016) TaxID=1309411 RepID=A0ACC6KMQ6_9DEIO|nr:hypothetical protein [Deinococcus soli (ex Cha et al. 2016)]MDR6221181.1 Skp family chaperone for outer membrane proteins [Deinococcus soli (ex Cha et al. 2016)]MDR6331114.1 Skp family chaperone for outer membrane proteins [Deinococcus soli (ex Cha et al. 2016)]MDR6753722.1 Skp family chaperone for outer membrane proteins [Deinococcus soli (ex Cha et al. 2016)]